MGLFSDGPVSSVEDLSNQDSGLLAVCDSEQIDANVKLALAQEEIGLELSSLFERMRSNYTRFFGQPTLDLQHLAVTPTVRLWHTWQTLALVYRDAYYSQMNDRYQAKWEEFRSLAKWAQNKLLELGVGLVLDPLTRPDSPVLSLTPATESGGIFYISTTWVNAASEESACSIAQSITVPDGNAVDIATGTGPTNAVGWNVYVGVSPGAMYLQNGAPLPLVSDVVYYPSTAVTSGALPGTGQQPNLVRALPRMLQRG